MSLTVVERTWREIRDRIFRRYLGRYIKKLFGLYISLLFVYIPSLIYYAVTLGKPNETYQKQKRLRAKQVDESDPSSPYRAIESLEKLHEQPEKGIETLADIPYVCLERYGDKETMGVRDITNIEEEKQSNGKIFKKVCCFVNTKFNTNEIFSLHLANIDLQLIDKHVRVSMPSAEVYFH